MSQSGDDAIRLQDGHLLHAIQEQSKATMETTCGRCGVVSYLQNKNCWCPTSTNTIQGENCGGHQLQTLIDAS